jgi:hypothetical protein
LMSQAPYSCTKAEWMAFLQRLEKIRFPTGYAGVLKKHIRSRKLGCIKSHNYHVLMEQVLPICIQGLVAWDLYTYMKWLCFFIVLVVSNQTKRSQERGNRANEQLLALGLQEEASDWQICRFQTWLTRIVMTCTHHSVVTMRMAIMMIMKAMELVENQ